MVVLGMTKIILTSEIFDILNILFNIPFRFSESILYMYIKHKILYTTID